MNIKVNNYLSTSSTNTTGTTTILNIPSEESFEDVLILNQAALKAMTIDAMVAESATGSINPDAVDAAAIMKFRSTLGSNVVAPMPKEDWDGGYTAQTVSGTTPSRGAESAGDVSTTPGTTPVSTDDVYNEGVLECSDELNAYFKEASEKYGIDVKLLKCIAFAESTFRPHLTSSAGAMGVMQLMPDTAKECGVEDAYDAHQNILGGTMYFAKMLNRYDGNIELALAAYNAGPGNVDKAGGIPFESTRRYVEKITGLYYS